VCR
jgi:hypothetical protein